MNRRAWLVNASALVVTATGCHHFFQGPRRAPQVEVPLVNPFQVGPADPELVWSQVVDTVDDYFRIKSETRVRRDSAAWMEGRLETFPEIGGTLFEPWRGDSTRGFERIQSTFQTIRRTAFVKVVPGADGYLIDVKVVKEKEDVDHSQYPTAGSSVQRHDGSVVRTANVLNDLPMTIDWYPAGAGRDLELERRLAERIAGRLTNIEAPEPTGILGH
ncbi:MAG: hypothetical protein IT423_04445 [Pirellulaceae bacterium]|nr:hypothetical protein [Pirellulaceae bacterium]